MYIKQNKIIQLEHRKNIESYNIQLKFKHTPVQVNGLKLIRKREIYNNYRKLILYSMFSWLTCAPFPPPILDLNCKKKKKKNALHIEIEGIVPIFVL